MALDLHKDIRVIARRCAAIRGLSWPIRGLNQWVSPHRRSTSAPCDYRGHYGVAVESDDLIALDLDRAAAEIQLRWFVWNAAGLKVHPLTWTDQDNATRRVPLVGRSEVRTPRSLGLHVSRPVAHADIVLDADGRAKVAILRPEASAVVHETAHLETVAAFGELLDRVVELITWNGVPKDQGAAPERAARWVLGYDGDRWPIEA